MAHQTWIADALRAEGCRVTEVDGWQTRGSSTFNPRGVVAHHTAGPDTGDMPSLGVLINGRPGLPGPLAQVGLARSGLVYVIAAGRANHAGAGTWKGLSGNSSVFGIEAENTGVGEPWPQVQLDAYGACVAALLRGIKQSAEWACGHREWTSRKIDPTGIDLPVGRDVVARILASPPGGAPAPTPPSKDWFDMATQADLKKVVDASVKSHDDLMTERLRGTNKKVDGVSSKIDQVEERSTSRLRGTNQKIDELAKQLADLQARVNELAGA